MRLFGVIESAVPTPAAPAGRVVSSRDRQDRHGWGFAVGLAMALALAAFAPAASASSRPVANSANLTRIARPVLDQVVGNGRVDVVLQSRASLGALRVSVNGRDVKRYFHRSAGGYRATLQLGHGLQLGVDELLVLTDRGADFDRVTFIVAQRASNLLTVSSLLDGGPQAPVRAVVGVAPDATLQAWINGHRDDGAFQPQGSVYVGRLGANDWMRPGRNQLVLLAYRTDRSGRSAVYDVEGKTFWRKPGQLTAGAGPDQIGNAGSFIRLLGSASRTGVSGTPVVTYRWRIVGQPAGARATLQNATSRSPGFLAPTAGTYLISVTVRAANGTSSVDTVTVTERADVPPIGARLDTAADDRGTIKLDGAAVPGTTAACDPSGTSSCDGYASYAVFNRQTLELVTSGSVSANIPGTKLLADLATSYNKAPTYLMVVNFRGPMGNPEDGRTLLQTLGVAKMSDRDRDRTLQGSLPVSIIGVPGSPAGSAFISNHFLNCDINGQHCYGQPAHLANMSGYLRLNPLSTTGDFEFVFPDQVEFNTDASPAPSEITMKVGDQTYAHTAPTDGRAGFFLVRLHSHTLALDQDFTYFTNNADGSENAAEAKRLADDLAWASARNNDHGELLVMLQAFGRPKGTSNGWLEAAAAIGRLGGNAQVFAFLNRGASDEPHQGRYAFVARSAMDAASAESSQSLTGLAADGKLHGLLARGRDDQYEPLVADPAGTVNFDLVKIVNRPSPPDGGFPAFTGGQAAAATFLGRDPDVIGVCDRQAPTCDVRKAYYEKYVGTNWSTILTRLGSDATKTKCAESHPDFTAADCNAVRQEFELEIGRRNTVEEYFGPKGLQAPFIGGVQVAALVDIAKVAEDIKAAVQPPPENNSTSHVLAIMTFITKIGGFAGAINPAAGAVAAGLSGAFGLAAYLTRHDGSPDVIGPQVTTAAARLGGDLFDRYQRVSSYFTTEAKVVMSDWSKMSAVAAVATSNPKWALGDIATSTEMIRLGTKQAIYQALVPVAYPVLYDLGTGVSHATGWQCIGLSFTYDKHLFQHTGTGAELTYHMTDPRYLGQYHVLAVGARNAVDHLHDAYIPAPPDSLTGPLFRDPAAPQGGGIGLFKLNFYSPQNFQVFPEVLQQVHRSDDPYGYHTCQSMPDPPGNSG